MNGPFLARRNPYELHHDKLASYSKVLYNLKDLVPQETAALKCCSGTYNYVNLMLKLHLTEVAENPGGRGLYYVRKDGAFHMSEVSDIGRALSGAYLRMATYKGLGLRFGLGSNAQPLFPRS